MRQAPRTSRSSRARSAWLNVTAAGPLDEAPRGRELARRHRIAVVGRRTRERRRRRRRESSVRRRRSTDRRGVATGRANQSVDDELVRQRRDVHLAVRHRWRAELREVAERVPRGVLLAVPELAGHVARVVGAEDAGLRHVVGVAGVRERRPENSGAGDVRRSPKATALPPGMPAGASAVLCALARCGEQPIRPAGTL